MVSWPVYYGLGEILRCINTEIFYKYVFNTHDVKITTLSLGKQNNNDIYILNVIVTSRFNVKHHSLYEGPHMDDNQNNIVE